MNDELIAILEKVQDATDAEGAQADAMEALLLEDPSGFADRYRDHLTERERARLGSVTV